MKGEKLVGRTRKDKTWTKEEEEKGAKVEKRETFYNRLGQKYNNVQK